MLCCAQNSASILYNVIAVQKGWDVTLGSKGDLRQKE